MREKQKFLLLVEGEIAEPKFFKNFAKKLGMDVSIFAVKTNIYALYSLLRSERFQMDVKTAAATLTHSEDDKGILAQDYQCTYLVYDCDAQQTYGKWFRQLITSSSKYIRKNFEILEEMVEYFNDEYDETVGKLLLNYPMLESYADTNAFFMNEYGETSSPIVSGKIYKREVSHRVIKAKPVSKYEAGDFSDLTTQNAYKLAQIMTGDWRFPTFDEMKRILDQKTILSTQKRLAYDKHRLWVLNTSVLLPLLLYKKEAGYYDRLSIPRKNVSITLILPVVDFVKRDHVLDFLDKLYQQRFHEWECIIVVPMHMRDGFLSIGCECKNIKVILDEADTGSMFDRILKGVRQATSDYVVPCLALYPPVATALISLAGLFQVYQDCDVAVFRRGYKLTWWVKDERWPCLGVRPISYPIRKVAQSIKACEIALAKASLFDICIRRSLFIGVAVQLNIKDFWKDVVSKANHVIKTDLTLFKFDLKRLFFAGQYRRCKRHLMVCNPSSTVSAV